MKLLAETIVSFLISYFAEKGLDHILDTETLPPSQQIEEQIFLTLEQALRNLCEKNTWEYDGTAFREVLNDPMDIAENLSGANCERVLKEILSSAIGKSIDDNTYQSWLYCLQNAICSNQFLWNYLQGNKIREILSISKKQRPENSGKIQRSDFSQQECLVNLYDELCRVFEQSFSDTAEKEKRELSPQEQINIEDGKELVLFQTSLLPVTEHNAEEEQPEENNGKHFTFRNPLYINTLAFQIDRMAIPEKRKWIYVPNLLDSTTEYFDNEKSITFYADFPSPDGNPVLFVNWDSERNVVYINMGFMEYDQIKISKRPESLRITTTPYEAEVWKETFFESPFIDIADTDREEGKEEFLYTFHNDHIFIIIDLEGEGKIIKPQVNDKGEGSIWLERDKKYLIFEMTWEKNEKINHNLSDYELGCAYLNGDYGLRKSREKAKNYFRLATIAGDEHAKSALQEWE